jgi:3',5'-cyclic AMP phosphodiesterase CpdA
MQISAADGVCLVHVSDLHLHPPLTERGRRLKRSLGTRTHSYGLLAAASQAIRQICNSEGPRTTGLAVTGDLTTAGDPLAFALARQIVTATDVLENGVSYPVGFNGGFEVFLVPGNHDRFSGNYIARQQSAFEYEFHDVLQTANWRRYGLHPSVQSTASYPRLPFVRLLRSQSATSGQSGISVVVIGLDSTELNRAELLDPLGRIARGRVSRRSLQYMQRACDDLQKNRQIQTSDGVEHDLSTDLVWTLVLLHHHPHLPPDQRNGALTMLVNAPEVLNTCTQAGVNLLLYGHQHVAFVDPVTIGSHTGTARQILCSATGSTCIFDEVRGNSFNVYRFTSNAVDFENWRYDEGLFRPRGYSGRFFPSQHHQP